MAAPAMADEARKVSTMIKSVHLRYIPAGTLTISGLHAQAPVITDKPNELRDWRAFTLATHEQQNDDHGSAPKLPQPVQAALAASDELSPFIQLLRHRWIHLEFSVSRINDDIGIVRVYLLPEDVARSSIDRSDRKLAKALQLLLRRLNFSKSAWLGQHDVQMPSPPLSEDERPRHDESTGDLDQSLLQMFNNITSPMPTPEDVRDPHVQSAMYALLESNVEGLNTELLHYQRRSAAVMVQRESCPRMVLDPRLRQRHDQDGVPWFYDEVSGTVLREARYYDGASGGILAEEMGAGKTLICLALILATKHLPAKMPSLRYDDNLPVRRRVGSLADMAAASITRHSVPWRHHFDDDMQTKVVDRRYAAICRNPAYYDDYLNPPRRSSTTPRADNVVIERVFLSHASLVIVPNNLLEQWTQEIRKHTSGLNVLRIAGSDPSLPDERELLRADIVLFSQGRFEKMLGTESPLNHIHFKRCIVDEGHRLGHSRISAKSNLLLMIDRLHIESRWIVTGTPSQGLFGVENGDRVEWNPAVTRSVESSNGQERRDLERLGAMAALYLKVRPWANTSTDQGDKPADWAVYVMRPRHTKRSSGRPSCLQETLNAMIIRHRLVEISSLLPSVDEKVIYLEGSYQDKLALNLFSMMIVFNSVQSQRTDRDYFFHQTQRKARDELWKNLRQASFFGGVFFSAEDISKAVETAEAFLEKKEIDISAEDEVLLRDAIAIGRLALGNMLKDLSHKFHEMPVVVENFPESSNAAAAWSLDGNGGLLICTSFSMIHEAQKFLLPYFKKDHPDPNGWRSSFASMGLRTRSRALQDAAASMTSTKRGLAGNTQLGEEDAKKHRSQIRKDVSDAAGEPPEDTQPVEFSSVLAHTRLTATVSTKLSYLIDSIVQHYAHEQIIVFYENENVAFYVATALDALQIPNLIYAKSLRIERRAQYVTTFNKTTKFRVLLMDMTQAAFGLDMQSASRIYFLSPVLNPQVAAQAIGRARRISQQKPVSVETLVLKGSIEELIVSRRQAMTQAEHRKVRNILDDKPIFEWIKNPRFIPLPDGPLDFVAQMSPLKQPQFIFAREAARISHPDEDIVTYDALEAEKDGIPKATSVMKRKRDTDWGSADDTDLEVRLNKGGGNNRERPARRVRFSDGDGEENDQ